MLLCCLVVGAGLFGFFLGEERFGLIEGPFAAFEFEGEAEAGGAFVVLFGVEGVGLEEDGLLVVFEGFEGEGDGGGDLFGAGEGGGLGEEGVAAVEVGVGLEGEVLAAEGFLKLLGGLFVVSVLEVGAAEVVGAELGEGGEGFLEVVDGVGVVAGLEVFESLFHGLAGGLFGLAGKEEG